MVEDDAHALTETANVQVEQPQARDPALSERIEGGAQIEDSLGITMQHSAAVPAAPQAQDRPHN